MNTDSNHNHGSPGRSTRPAASASTSTTGAHSSKGCVGTETESCASPSGHSKNKKLKLTPRLLLRELREMARLEMELCMNDEQQARNVWQEIKFWAEGAAAMNKIRLEDTAAERLERQRRIFNHG